MKKILIIILILILPMVALAANLFSDSFESGDFTQWSFAWEDGGDCSITVAAALHGTYGMSVFVQDTDAKGVQDATPSAETRYRVRFYFDPNGITMGEGDVFFPIFLADDSFDEALHVEFKYTAAGGYQVKASDRTDGAWDKTTSWYTFTDDVHCFEFDWQASSGVGQNDGRLQLWIDGVSKEEVTDIDSDTETIDFIYFGAVSGLDAGTSGTMYFDDFASNDDGSLIGQLGDNAIMFGCNF